MVMWPPVDPDPPELRAKSVPVGPTPEWLADLQDLPSEQARHEYAERLREGEPPPIPKPVVWWRRYCGGLFVFALTVLLLAAVWVWR
jgi:hypothetical protein